MGAVWVCGICGLGSLVPRLPPGLFLIITHRNSRSFTFSGRESIRKEAGASSSCPPTSQKDELITPCSSLTPLAPVPQAHVPQVLVLQALVPQALVPQALIPQAPVSLAPVSLAPTPPELVPLTPIAPASVSLSHLDSICYVSLVLL